ncbi:MAG: hypothetical protein RLZZ408_963 [Verrucomicrobiota bacterium]
MSRINHPGHKPLLITQPQERADVSPDVGEQADLSGGTPRAGNSQGM